MLGAFLKISMLWIAFAVVKGDLSILSGYWLVTESTDWTAKLRKGSCVSIYNHFDGLKVNFESVDRKAPDANVIKDGERFFIREGDWQVELLRSDSYHMYWQSNEKLVVFTRAVKKDGRCELPEKNSIEKLTESTMGPLSVKEQFMLYGDYFAYQRYLQSHHVKYEIAATRLGKALKSWLIKTLKKCGENQIPFELVKPKNRRDRYRRGYCWYYCQIGHCAKGNNCDFIHPNTGPSTTDNSFASTKDTSRRSSPEYLGDLDELPNVQVTTPR